MSTFFIISLSTGIILFLTSMLLLKYPPKKSNSWYGYRTTQSRSTQEKWDFAQIYSAQLMKISGGLLILVSPMAYLIDISLDIETLLSCCLVGAATLIPIIMTENKMKELD